MKWSSSIRKWSRLIHRDLSFFFAGMVLIYAISGIVMNHRDTINPNFSIERKEYKIAEKLPGKEGMKRENVLTLLQPLGEEGNYTKHYFPKADIMKVFLKGGSNLQVNVRTGEAAYESVTPPPAHRSNGTPALQPRTMVDLLCGYFRSRPHHHHPFRSHHAERQQRYYRQRRNRNDCRNRDSHPFSSLLLNRITDKIKWNKS